VLNDNQLTIDGDAMDSWLGNLYYSVLRISLSRNLEVKSLPATALSGLTKLVSTQALESIKRRNVLDIF